MKRWSPGDAIAWRCRIRTPWGAKDDISYVFPMTLVRDTDGVRRRGDVRSMYQCVNSLVASCQNSEIWRWKDDHELEWEVEHGSFTRAEADELYREGERAVARLRSQRAMFERWISWRPDPAWPLAVLPTDWDEP